MSQVEAGTVAAEDRARADLYAYLAALLAVPPSAALLARSAEIAGEAETPLGRAVARIAEAAGSTGPAEAEREFTRLFIGLGRGELLPFASYYLTGTLHDKPLARLRRDMARLGIARAAEVSEPEDHIASILEMMAGQILGTYGAPAPLATQKAFFDAHLEPWAGRFFADLREAKEARLYLGVGDLGAAFMKVESRAFALA